MKAALTFDISEVRPIGSIVAELVQDLLRAQLHGMSTQERKQFLMDLKARGVITPDELASWFCTYPDMGAA